MSKITRVKRNGPAYKYRIAPGDELLTVNGKPVRDVFDYRYLINDELVDLTVRKKNGAEKRIKIKKDTFEDLGLEFETGLMDDANHCSNKCVFCFIDQLPEGMRPTLYFKDDDARLSFLSGNYVTLTNLSGEDFDRILFYHLSPINISVHAIDPAIRVRLLKNKFAGGIKERLRKLSCAGISMNFQAVLCKGINDGAALEETIRELAKFLPLGQSLSLVPAGLTKYRSGLPALDMFTAESAIKILDTVDYFQARCLRSHGTRFVFAADEFYLLAGRPAPGYDEYEEFFQLENGVGMITLFEKEITDALGSVKRQPAPSSASIVTGMAAGPFIKGICGSLMKTFPQIKISVHPIVNDFFGENITVSGLLTARDIINQLKNQTFNEKSEKLLIPANALRDGIFLDDKSLKDVSLALGARAEAVPVSGGALLAALNII